MRRLRPDERLAVVNRHGAVVGLEVLNAFVVLPKPSLGAVLALEVVEPVPAD